MHQMQGRYMRPSFISAEAETIHRIQNGVSPLTNKLPNLSTQLTGNTFIRFRIKT